MPDKECIAMLLAGGQGSRLRVLTKNVPKPAVPFGGGYRIIDFSLSNCRNSGIDTVGVLTQYKPQFLNAYIGLGHVWDLERVHGGVSILPPYVSEDGGQWYNGTAHAVYQNLAYIDRYHPDYVVILSGDHIYKMDYAQLLHYHKAKQAEVTIAVIHVPPEEASRYGIMSTAPSGEIIEFEEKPAQPKSTLASMGVYVFNTAILRSYLHKDAQDSHSQNDFGKNVIPRLLQEKRKVFAYPFTGYWKDVGTIDSYWSASMDILDDKLDLDLFDQTWPVYSGHEPCPPHFIGELACVKNSLIAEGCVLEGDIEHSVIFPGVHIGKDSQVKDAVVMSHVRIGTNVRIENAIICEATHVGDHSIIGGKYELEDGLSTEGPMVTIVEDHLCLPAQSRIGVLLRMKRQDNKLSELSDVQRGTIS